ncbi:ABC transporter permease [Bradyrhizobium sp. ISRA443]|uniref:ABC transporter permease n=1 Tax=unclassified Bradyrhizobium TaxID=2631580 RepID=UPI00247A78F5|nr:MULTISPECIES: ABC transporter permease [unclassified Bradyrhizobium]WGR93712.1 ABC transporter permease [Bradyrhizobium sp. ISRA435]WGR98290.1 ABC transporter permease [Bradyrhizobium sp. ISRA436]WGS05178.1 ABC transporter permease [Bradyrhizobium sp. ISRA437]WGS12064.1 ABC transporter permease [Bradyrhizobium sp. ISRA443]
MRSLSYVHLAFRSVRAHILRSFLAVTGIVIGIAAVVIVVAVAEGARAEISKQINSLGSNLLLVKPGAQLAQGVRQQAGTILSLTTADALAIAREVPDIVIAAPFVGEQKTTVSGDLNWSTLVAGVTPEFFEARGWKLAEGQLLNDDHITSAAKVAVIGRTVARELFKGRDPLGRFLRIERASYLVIGVLAEKGQDFTGRDQDDVMFIPLSSAKIFTVGRSQANPDAVHTILVKTESAESMQAAESAIARVLRQRHKIVGRKSDDFSIQNLIQVAQTRDRAYRQFTLLVSTLAGISLLVGGIGVMNIMLVSVTERINEIGIRLAFGARPQDIRWQFLLEAVLLCTIGGLLGLVVGYGCARVVPSALGWPIEFNERMALIAIACSSFIGIVFGLLPAERAARLDPAVLLRSG